MPFTVMTLPFHIDVGWGGVLDSEGRLVAPPGLFRPDSDSTDSRNIQGTGEAGHVTAP
jgi:hypothetical protein